MPEEIVQQVLVVVPVVAVVVEPDLLVLMVLHIQQYILGAQ